MVLIRVAFLGDRRSRHVSLKLYPSRIKPEMITFVFLMVQKTVRSVIGNSHKREYLSRPCKRFNHMLNSKLVNFISPPNHACYKWVCQSACIHDLYFLIFFRGIASWVRNEFRSQQCMWQAKNFFNSQVLRIIGPLALCVTYLGLVLNLPTFALKKPTFARTPSWALWGLFSLACSMFLSDAIC